MDRKILSTGCNTWHILVYQDQTRDTKIEQLMQISGYKSKQLDKEEQHIC